MFRVQRLVSRRVWERFTGCDVPVPGRRSQCCALYQQRALFHGGDWLYSAGGGWGLSGWNFISRLSKVCGTFVREQRLWHDFAGIWHDDSRILSTAGDVRQGLYRHGPGGDASSALAAVPAGSRTADGNRTGAKAYIFVASGYK